MSDISSFSRVDQQRAVIAWLAEHCGSNGNLGKTAFQKLVYSLSEICGVDTGYQFSIYTYGPFSRDLAGDLDIAERTGAVRITYIANENRYEVKSGAHAEEFIRSNEQFIDENMASLSWISENLGNKSARYLELFSTLHYILNHSDRIGDDAAVQALISMKPKFDIPEVKSCLSKVREIMKSMGRHATQ